MIGEARIALLASSDIVRVQVSGIADVSAGIKRLGVSDGIWTT